jgi:hypothetical protein
MTMMMTCFSMQMMDTVAAVVAAETIGLVAAETIGLAAEVVERTLVITFSKGCVSKPQTSCKTREPCKKMHGNNCVNNMAQFR